MAMASSGEVEEETTMSGNEEREEESNSEIAGEDVLAGRENDGEVNKRKKEKRDHMKLFDEKEMTVKKKKKKGKDNVVGVGIKGRKGERIREMPKGDTKADDKANNGCEGGNEGTEKESKDGVNGEGAKMRRKEMTGDVMRSAREERKLEKKMKNKKDGVLAGHENVGEVKKRKRDHMKLINGKETTVENKKKKNERDDVLQAGIEWKVVERKKEMPKDDTNVHNKEKKRKVKEIEDVVFAANEANCKVLKSKKRKRDSSKESNKSRVGFSEEMKDLPPFDEDGLVRGKRFSNVENELIKNAVDRYIEAMQLGEEGLDMILHCRSHPQVKDCWKVISAALPWRPYRSVYCRAQILYRRGDSKWTREEVEFVREFYKKNGPKWNMMADKLGKYHLHVHYAFMRYKLVDPNKGKWSQDEYRRLFELVNEDLLMKVSEEKKSMYGMLKDNIHWTAISDELGTRNNARCCDKWYQQLTSPMVAQGEWADVDDYRMVTVLVGLDASCEEEVDWENLLGHRSGDLCRKRWLQMSRHLGEHGNKSFSEQVDVLSKRYCPDFAEVREALDARPVVD